MANTLDAVIPQLLAQGLLALRENTVMPFLVNRQYEALAGPEGSTIDVPIPSAVAATQVVPAEVPSAAPDTVLTSVPINLDRWYEAVFYMTDRDMLEVQAGTIPMQASEAVKALANEVDSYLLGLGTQFYGSFGTPGAVPFGDGETGDATGVRAVLNNQLAPLPDRWAVLDPTAEASALNVRAFQDLSWNGSAMAIIEGQLNRKMGFGWWMDQNVGSFTGGDQDGNFVTNGAAALGATSLALITGANEFVVGDIFTVAGDTQQYVVTTGIDGPGTISFQPGLQVATSGGEAIAQVTNTTPGTPLTMTNNITFHRDAMAFATRPLASSSHPGVMIQSAVDPVSGLTLRLEVSREHKQDRFSYDILYGANVVRRELGARLFGSAP